MLYLLGLSILSIDNALSDLTVGFLSFETCRSKIFSLFWCTQIFLTFSDDKDLRRGYEVFLTFSVDIDLQRGYEVLFTFSNEIEMRRVCVPIEDDLRDLADLDDLADFRDWLLFILLNLFLCSPITTS